MLWCSEPESHAEAPLDEEASYAAELTPMVSQRRLHTSVRISLRCRQRERLREPIGFGSRCPDSPGRMVPSLSGALC